MASNPYMCAAAAIQQAPITLTQKYRARQLLEYATPDNGCLVLSPAEARELFGVGSGASVRRTLGRLKAAGLIHYCRAPQFYMIVFLSWTPWDSSRSEEVERACSSYEYPGETHEDPACANRARESSGYEHPCSGYDDADEMALERSNAEDTACATSEHRRAELAHPRSSLDRRRANWQGVKGGRDINRIKLKDPSLPRSQKPEERPRSPEQDAAYRLLTELLNPPVEDLRAADETARRFPFDAIYAHALRYEHDLSAGTVQGPGALLHRIWHWPARDLGRADCQTELYAQAWGETYDPLAGYTVPPGYEDLIGH